MWKESQVICPLFSSLLAVMMVLKLLVKKCWHHVQGDLAVMNISDLACLVGIDFGAKLLASLAKCFKDECQKEDNLSLRNLTLLLSYLGFTQGTGMRLRSDDPVTMKSFIVTIQNKVTELKAASGDSQGNMKGNMRSKRTEFMLETIFDIKNNKGRLKRIPYIIPASKSGFKRYSRGKSG